MPPKPNPKTEAERKKVAELQNKLEQLKRQFSSGLVVKNPENAKLFMEQISTLAQQIATMGQTVVTSDAQKRKELDDAAKNIAQMLKFMPGSKG